MPVPLEKVVGLRLESVCIDVLHCVDLGVAARILGHGVLGLHSEARLVWHHER